MALAGTITALVTPLKNGTVDLDGLKQNLIYQSEACVDGLLVLGTTGEGATLSHAERLSVIRAAASEKTLPLIVNVGDISTEATIQKAVEAEKEGADALLIIAPYYVRPSQDGLARHFEAIAKKTSLPILLYNHPKRTGVTIEIKTLVRLAAQKNIIGIKDASGSIPYAAAIRSALPDFLLFAGDDLLSLPYQAIGAKGVISVLSNLFPQDMATLTAGSYHRLISFMELSQVETNPVPIKAMMNLAGLPAGEIRAPLAPLAIENEEKIKQVMGDLCIK
ncbi:MAG: 4-hydroxy-tetrahydrodipicolinate synthase [Chlamydiia bacterium]|nr:4-hydroxy-tetrahydrodipicolinate synthase [Chlamydiia bacterium]